MSDSEPSSPLQSPTSSQSLLTTDDRAQLLPAAGKKEVPPPSPSADIQAQVKSSIVDASREVYTITDESLPTHMRSLLPSHEQHVHDLLTLERTRRRLRYVIIGLTVLLALTVLVAVALVFSLKVKPGSGALEMGRRYRVSPVSATDTQVEVATELQFSLLSRENRPSWPSYKRVGADDKRSPCIKECWTYAAFRFRSVCENGYCRCHGENYDTNTCLPIYQGCHIQRRSPKTAPAKLFGKNQTTYSCLSPSRDAGKPSVHVVSIFGNHRSLTTHVKVQNRQPVLSPATKQVPVKGDQPQSSVERILVLVNYHYVMWTVHLPPKSGISKVIVVSMKPSSQADQVRFVGSPDDLQKPEVIHKLSLTGYGQDKNVGHTPKLLKFIDEEIGPLKSFLGAPHADEIILDLNDGSENQPTMPVIIGETTTSTQ